MFRGIPALGDISGTRTMGISVMVCVVLAVSAILPVSAGAALTHEYSFNDGTADDSVGGVNGVLMGGASVSGGQL
jgi:hypothetical protein